MEFQSEQDCITGKDLAMFKKHKCIVLKIKTSCQNILLKIRDVLKLLEV